MIRMLLIIIKDMAQILSIFLHFDNIFFVQTLQSLQYQSIRNIIR
jgi:hypothetical protein